MFRNKLIRWCGILGTGLICIGIWAPFTVTRVHAGTFAHHYPLQTWLLTGLALLAGLFVIAKKIYATIITLVIFIPLATMTFSHYYFGHVHYPLFNNYLSPLKVPGWSILELGLMLIGAGLIGHKLQPKQPAKKI